MVPEDTDTSNARVITGSDVHVMSLNKFAVLDDQQERSSPALLPLLSEVETEEDSGGDKMDVDPPAPPSGVARAFGPQQLAEGVVIAEDLPSQGEELLEQVEKLWRTEKKIIFLECARALELCWSTRGEARAESFVRGMLEHILSVCLGQVNLSDRNPAIVGAFNTIFETACNLIAEDLTKRQTHLLKCLRGLCNDDSLLYTGGAQRIQQACLGRLQGVVRELLMGMELHDMLCSPLLQHERDIAALARCCREEVAGSVSGEAFTEELGRRLVLRVRQQTPDAIVSALSDGQYKQMNADALERLERLVAEGSGALREELHLAWAEQAVQCVRSEKIMVRRAGLEVLIALAKVAPEMAGAWLVRGGDESVLAYLTGERAHEKLVDALRALIYTKEKAASGPVEAGVLDKILATCLGSSQHPTKDVREAFRSAVAKLTLTMPEGLDAASPRDAAAEHRLAVSLHIVDRLHGELQLRTAGAELLTLELFRDWEYDVVSVCTPSPKFLVTPVAEQGLSALAQGGLRLLCTALVSPMLAGRYSQLLHALAVCLQAGPSSDRPGSRTALAGDVQQLVLFCCELLDERNGAGAHERTVGCKLLLDLLFFHLRSDSVAAPNKWINATWDHPRNYEWAREGKVPMLGMTRAVLIEELCKFNVIDLVVRDCLRLEQQAITEGRQEELGHRGERWVRLELLRFMHVEADEKARLFVSLEILADLWRLLPTEECCKWLRVLADSGEALNEEVTEAAFKQLVCGVDLPRLGKHGFNCFEALFGEINSRITPEHPRGRMQISGRQVVHKGIKISGQNLVRRRVSWFCCTGLRRNVGTITAYDDSAAREKDPFDFENDEMFDGRNKTNQLVQLRDLFDCHVVEDHMSPEDLKAFVIDDITIDLEHHFGCNLVGMDELWRVAIEALDDGAARRAWDLLLALSRKLPDQFVQDFLVQVFKEVRPLESEEAVGGGGLRISRALSLLQTLLDAHVLDCDSRGVMPHAGRARGHALRVTIRRVGKARARTASNGSSAAAGGEGPRAQEEEVSEVVHSNLRLKELQELCSRRLSREGGCERLELKLGETLLVGRGRTLGALGVGDGALLHAVAPEEGGRLPQRTAATVLRAMADADAEGMVAARYEVLLRRLEDEEQKGCGEGLQRQLWEVLMSLPSAPHLLESVRRWLGGEEAWEAGGAEGIWLGAYRWQMVQAQLLPLREEEHRRADFAEQGGVRQLMQLLPRLCRKGGAWCCPGRLSWQVLLPVLLRVLRILLDPTLCLAHRAHHAGDNKGRADAAADVDFAEVMELLLDAIVMVCAEVEAGQEVCRELLLDCLQLSQALIKEMPRVAPGQRAEVIGKLFGGPLAESGGARLVRWLLIGGRDEAVRNKVMQLLLDAVVMGAVMGSGGVSSDSQSAALSHGVEGKTRAVNMVATATELLRMTLAWPVPGGEGSGLEVHGQEFFEWVCRVVRLRVEGEYLLKVDENRQLLEQSLELLTGASRPKEMTAAGLLRVLTQLLSRLPASVWSPLAKHVGATQIIFSDYLMASHPAGSPLLGWPDDARSQDARRGGWDPILKMVSLHDEACLQCLAGVVAQTRATIQAMPLPQLQTEDGAEELQHFEPEHNGLRHSRGLVGLKNRRNTCYINSMLQNLFFTPQFCAWIAADPPCAAAAEGRTEESALSAGLLKLMAALRFSEKRFFDPVDFVRACKRVERHPPLLDASHTQDDTMTFLEGLLESLAAVHGPVPDRMFKVVEKERRWLEGSMEPRPINGSEKEYLMLEIEEGIGDMKRAMGKHFSQELMTGDNRIWNEKIGVKETVWKAPFIEEECLPEVMVVQLKRFKHNVTWDGRFESQKVNTKVEFDMQLDMSEYVYAQRNEYEAAPAEAGSAVFELQGLIVHSGQTIHSGHYYAFIHDAAAGVWFRLDDDAVTEVSESVVREESCGGTVESKDQYGDIRREHRWRSAYVLFYRRLPPAPRAPAPRLLCPMPGVERFRGEVEAGSLAAAQQLLAFDAGFLEFVASLISLAAHALSCSSPRIGTPQREEADGAMEVAGSLTVGPAEDADEAHGAAALCPSPRWPSPTVQLPAQVAREVCWAGVLALERVASRKMGGKQQAGRLAEALKALVEQSAEGARAVLEGALEGGWVEKMVVGHASSEVRGGAAALVGRAARSSLRWQEAAMQVEEGAATVAGAGEVVGRVVEAVLAASAGAAGAWGEAAASARQDRGQLDAYLELAVELVQGGVATAGQTEAVVRALLEMCSANAQDRPALTKMVAKALLGVKEQRAARELLEREGDQWGWLPQWLHRQSSPFNPDLAPAARAPCALQAADAWEALRAQLLPHAAPLERLSKCTPRVTVEGAGLAEVNGSYLLAGQVEHRPVLTRLVGARTLVLLAVPLGLEEAVGLLGAEAQTEVAALARAQNVSSLSALSGAVAEVVLETLPPDTRAVLFRSVRWVLACAPRRADWQATAARLRELSPEQRQQAGWEGCYHTDPAVLPADLAPGSLVLCHPAATDVEAEQPPEAELALVKETLPDGLLSVENLSTPHPDRALVSIDPGRVTHALAPPPQSGWLPSQPNALLPPPSISNPLLAPEAPPPQVVDLTGGGEHEELVRQLQEKILEVAGTQIREARAKELLEKGAWHLDNATMAFFDSMDS